MKAERRKKLVEQYKKQQKFKHGRHTREEHLEHYNNSNSLVSRIYKKYYIDKKPKNKIKLIPNSEPFIKNRIWDCFKGTYRRYILGVGLVDDKLQYILADENSDYYKAIIDYNDRMQYQPEILEEYQDLIIRPDKILLKDFLKKDNASENVSPKDKDVILRMMED